MIFLPCRLGASRPGWALDADIVVIGSGIAGLSAVLHARAAVPAGRVLLVTKAHLDEGSTRWAQGGIAAALAPEDSPEDHLADTLTAGVGLCDVDAVRILVTEGPARVRELAELGAAFDRDGSTGGFALTREGGHLRNRIVHAGGDATGLEVERALIAAVRADPGVEVIEHALVLDLLLDADGNTAGVTLHVLGEGSKDGVGAAAARAVILATGGMGQVFAATTNPPVSTGDGVALALRAGAVVTDLEFVQFHPTGMVWPPSVKGILVTEGVRGDGGVLLNSEGRRFMFDYIPPVFAAETADSEEEADRWYTDKKTARRPPELLPRDEVARAINAEIKAGRGSPHGGVHLDIASRRDPEYIRRRLPSMYHQFTELADVDITREPMEVGPTCHYVMGGIKVDPSTAAATVPGLFAAGECAAGMHGSNRLGGNSLSDLLVFGRRAGLHAARYAQSLPARKRAVADDAQIDATAAAALAPFAAALTPGSVQAGTASAEGTASSARGTTSARDSARTSVSPSHPPENPYQLQNDLQDVMQRLVGIIRTESELVRALKEIETLRSRARHVAVVGHRQYNPGWHLALDLGSLLTVAECITTAALARRESRGGHTRDDYPSADPAFATLNHVLRLRDGRLVLTTEPLPAMPPELAALFEDAGAESRADRGAPAGGKGS